MLPDISVRLKNYHPENFANASSSTYLSVLHNKITETYNDENYASINISTTYKKDKAPLSEMFSAYSQQIMALSSLKPSKQVMKQCVTDIVSLYDFVSFYLYRLNDNDELELVTKFDKEDSEPPRELLKVDKERTIDQPSIDIFANNYRYLIASGRFGNSYYIAARAIRLDQMQFLSYEKNYMKFFSTILAVWDVCCSQANSLIAFNNLLELVSKMKSFTVIEFFNNLGIYENKTGILFSEEEDPIFLERQKTGMTLNTPDCLLLSKKIRELLKDGKSFSQLPIETHIKDKTYYLQAGGIRKFNQYHNRDMTLVMFENTTNLKQQQNQKVAAIEDMRVASELLNLHHFVMTDNELVTIGHGLFDELGYTDTTERHFVKLLHPDDSGVLEHAKEREKVTFRLLNSEGQYQWYSGVIITRSPKFKGFMFSVNEMTNLLSSLKSTKDCFKLVSATEMFKFMNINLEERTPSLSIFPTFYLYELKEILHPDDIEKLNIEELKESETFEARLLHINRYEWYMINIIPTGNRQLLLIAFNIDESKRARELISQTEQMLNFAFTYTDARMWSFNPDVIGDCVLTSKPDESPIVEMGWNTLEYNLLSEFQDKVRNTFLHALESDERFELEVPFIIDTLRWILMRGIRVCTSEGTILMGVYVDVTHMHEVSSELERQRQMAEEASMAKSTFLSSMSHEIRTPLNGICGLLELLHTPDLTKEQRELTTCIQTSFNDLLELLNDTLDLAKIESKKMVPQNIEFSPCDVILQLQENTFVRKRNPDFEFCIIYKPETPITFQGDPHSVVRIIGDLLANSCKYTSRGLITVSFDSRDDNFVIGVRDTGIGMDEERRLGIIEHFNSGESMNVGDESSVGIGLSFVCSMTHLLKGSINVESTVGSGSYFEINLPFKPLLSMAPVKPSDQKILKIVRSKKYNDDCIREYGRFWGYEVMVVPQVPSEFDVLFVDIDEPKQSEDLKALLTKISDERPIAVLSYSETTEFQGKTHLFTKPLKPTQLHQFFKDVTSGKNVKDQKERKLAREDIWILAADDNPTNRLVMTKMLQKLKFSFKVVNNGKEAVEESRRKSYNVILMDQHMPEMDGPAATREIRKVSTVPVIALTASTLQEDEDECRNAGMNDFLCKPVTLKALEKAILAFAPE